MLENMKNDVVERVKQILNEKYKEIFGDATVLHNELSSHGLEVHCPEGSVKSEDRWNCSKLLCYGGICVLVFSTCFSFNNKC